MAGAGYPQRPPDTDGPNAARPGPTAKETQAEVAVGAIRGCAVRIEGHAIDSFVSSNKFKSTHWRGFAGDSSPNGTSDYSFGVGLPQKTGSY